MDRRVTIAWLIGLNVLLAFGDYLSKRAVDGPTRNIPMTTSALVLWFAACLIWLPVMRTKGFVTLVALADVIGLIMLAVIGYTFLGERLNLQQGAGLGFAIAAILLLGMEF